MAHRVALNRGARAALAIVLMACLAAVFLALRTFVGAPAQTETAPAPSVHQDRIVSLRNGMTIYLGQGLQGRRLLDWANGGDRNSIALELGDETFEPGSSELSPDGSAQLANLARMLKAHPDVTTTLVLMSPERSAAESFQRLRAERLRTQIVRHGIDQSRVAIVTLSKAPPLPENLASQPKHNAELLLLLSRT